MRPRWTVARAAILSPLSSLAPLFFSHSDGRTMADVTRLEVAWGETIRQLHGLAASLADSKQRYERSGDARYLQSVANVYPLFASTMRKAQDIASQLSGTEMPSTLLLTLSDTGAWLAARSKEVVEGTTGIIAGAGDAARNLGSNAASVTKWLIAGVALVALAYASGQLNQIRQSLKR